MQVIADQENQVDDLEEAIRALPPSSTALSGVYGHAHVLSSASAMEKTVLKVLALPVRIKRGCGYIYVHACLHTYRSCFDFGH